MVFRIILESKIKAPPKKKKKFFKNSFFSL